MYSNQGNPPYGDGQGGGGVGSPPLHHPIPQHPIPPFRSPPPAEGYQRQQSGQQQQPQGSNPYAPPPEAAAAAGNANSSIPPTAGAAGGGGFTGAYPNLFNDPSAQIGIEVGRNALNYGQEYIGKNINQYVSFSAFKYYFQVSNSYVLRKIVLVLFPWRHKPWTRTLQRSENSGAIDGYATAREDINAPDMYIPVMAFTTYILLSSVFAGIHGTFHPKILGYVASKAIAFMLVELMLLKLGTYLLSAGSKLLDFTAYSGYKFIGIIINMLVSALIPSSIVRWAVFLYTASSNSFFLLRSLRYILLPDNSVSSTHTINPGQRQRRIQFLFFYSFVCQFILMWFLLGE